MTFALFSYLTYPTFPYLSYNGDAMSTRQVRRSRLRELKCCKVPFQLRVKLAKSYVRGELDVAILMSNGFICNNSLPELADNDTLYAWEKDNLRIYTEHGKITKPSVRLDKAN